MFVIYLEAIIYLLKYNLHDCTFKYINALSTHPSEILKQLTTTIRTGYQEISQVSSYLMNQNTGMKMH